METLMVSIAAKLTKYIAAFIKVHGDTVSLNVTTPTLLDWIPMNLSNNTKRNRLSYFLSP